MPGPDMEDYLKQGMYGTIETKPDERRRFLGTLRERVIIALVQEQIREKEIYPEVESALKSNPEANLLLNGNIDYSYLSKYTKLANKHNVESTIVTNKDHETDIGLVVAADYAVDKENIFVTKNIYEAGNNEQENKKGLFSLFNGFFKK